MSEDGIDRRNQDHGEITSLLQQIKLTMTVKDDIASIRRLGKIPPAQGGNGVDADAQTGGATKQPKPRPLLIAFKSPSSRKKILTNAKKHFNM